MGGQLGFQVWAPSLIIWVRATRLQVKTGAAYPEFIVLGLKGEGCQRQPLLWRVLQMSASIFFFFLRNFPIQAPLVQTSTWLLTQLSLALSQESCSSPCTLAGASATLVPARVLGTLLSLETLLTVRSFNVLYLWSLIFIYPGILLAVRSAPQIS